MKKIITLFCFVAGMQTVFAQDIDSLLSKYSAAKNDSLRLEAIIELYANFSEADPLLFLKITENFLTYSRKNKDKIGEAYANSMIGYSYRGLGNTSKSLEYAIKGFDIGNETGNEAVLAVNNLALGECYKDIGNYQQALKHFFVVAEIGERIKNENIKSPGYQNLGEVYLALNKLDSALMYEQKDYEICKRTGNNDFIG